MTAAFALLLEAHAWLYAGRPDLAEVSMRDAEKAMEEEETT